MTDEQQRLCSLIDGHCEAMKAQVVDSQVKMQYLENGHWLESSVRLSDAKGDRGQVWHRLAPVPRLIPLDQSDFLGERRVTHIRYGNLVCLVSATSDTTVCFFDYSFPYESIKREGLECSRDGGASFGPCSKMEASK